MNEWMNEWKEKLLFILILLIDFYFSFECILSFLMFLMLYKM